MVAVIFDFDGVLVDSEPLHLKAFQAVFAERQWLLDAQAYAERYLGYDDLDLLRTYARDHGLPLDEDEIRAIARRKGEIYERASAEGGLLYPGAAACVSRLGAAFPLAIASGSLRHEIESILTGASLRQAFRVIVGADDVVRSKPAPDSYRRAADLLGVRPSDAVAIEDSPWGLDSARAAGLRTIAVTTTTTASALSSADRTVASLDEVDVDLVRALAGVTGA